MEPTPDHHRIDPARPPGVSGESRSEVGLVELIDRALVRLDGLRDRPTISAALTALLVFLLAVGWGLSRWRAVDSFDERIPRVDELIAAGEPAAADGVEPPAGAAGSTVDRTVPSSTTTSTAPERRLVVHVSGAVELEGLVELTEGARLADAISAAGGPTATADIHRLNLAAPLADGMHIRVPEVGEEGGDADRPLIERAEPTDGGPRAVGGSETEPVNVNRAGPAELERLPGVGPAIASALVAWREENGPFASVDELLEVPGIGPAKLAAIEDQVVL